MICTTERWHSFNTLNGVKSTRHEKVRSFESRRGPKRRGGKKKKKHCFVSWKAPFFSCYFFITPFPLHFQDDF
jgi:hypothetical protein